MSAVAMDENERDRFARRRSRDLAWYAGGFVLGWGAFILRSNHLTPTMDPYLLGVECSAVLIWGWGALRTAERIRRMRRQPALWAAMSDEFYKNVQLRASRAAFIAIALALGIMLVAGMLIPSLQHIPAAIPVQLIVLVAVASLAAATIIYDRE
jgi:hypothetical protein